MLVDGNGPVLGGGSPLTEEQREFIRALGRSAVRKMIIAASGVVGTKLGEILISLFIKETPPPEPPDEEEHAAVEGAES